MKVFSPEGRPVPMHVNAVARPQSLEGLRVGLLDNTKSPVDKMMEHLEKRLREQIPGVEVFSIAKMTSGRPAGPAIMDLLRKNCDVLVNGLGD